MRNTCYVILFGLFQMWLAWRDVAEFSHTDLMRMVDERRVACVTITESTIQGEFREPQDGESYFVSAQVDPHCQTAS